MNEGKDGDAIKKDNIPTFFFGRNEGNGKNKVDACGRSGEEGITEY